jgi:hypothetical protein
MRLEPLYRLTFTYPEEWAVSVTSPAGRDEQYFFIAEGRAQGAIAGRFRGANHPRRRPDGTFLPDLQGVIETDDGATGLVEIRGYGRAYPPGRRQIVCSLTHVSDAEEHRRLNDVLCVGAGEVRAGEEETVLVVDVAELVWEPIPE